MYSGMADKGMCRVKFKSGAFYLAVMSAICSL